LINDILDFSKIEANRVELENIPFNLESVMDEVLNTTGIRAYEKRIEIAQRIYPDVPRYLKGDPVRLKQILINLIGNAVKFTAVGHILIRASLVSRTPSETILRFSVSDTGIGIPSNKVERIFQPFSQASGSTTREFGGTGLGLAISKKLAELMKGTIRVESPNPESHKTPGAIFHVDLTFELSNESFLDQDDVQSALKGKRVAVFSYDPALLNFYLQIFQDIGMIPTPITDAAQIPLLLYSENTSKDDFHIILIDDTVALSVIESSFCFNTANNEFRKKIVLMSSPFSKTDQELSSRYPGLSSHVSMIKKPFKLSQLSKLISDSLNHDPETKIPADDEESPATSDSGFNVLLVEDNTINQKVATKMLKKMGHTVTVANNGKEAIDILQSEKDFDLVLMDGQMPVMDGFRATEIIRINEKSTPGKDRMPIIALTANAMKGDKDKYLSVGMDDYIAKPVKFSDLSTMISKTMERKKAGVLAQHDPFTHPDVPEF
jgi:CheY-like chemotaxis protein